MVSSGVEIEEIQATKSEKFLAVVLGVFVLIGGIWFYVKADDYVRDAVPTPSLSSADQAAISRLNAAAARAGRAGGDAQRALQDLEVRREAYRTALEAHQPAGRLEREYRAAESAYARAQREVAASRRALDAARHDAAGAERREASRYDDEQRTEARLTFVIRLPFVAALLAFGVWLLSALRRRRSRYLPLAFGAVGAGTVLALVFATDYVTDYIDPLDLGPLVLSFFGIAVTLLGFVALQRYLARRIPYRRARKRECPYCGYPAGSGEHCEGCGRHVVAACTTCGQPRRVGVLHCSSCGAA
jgi:hypothetical protein